MQAPNIRTINEVILIGNIYNKPTVINTKTGTPLAVFTVATNDEWKDSKTGELKRRPCYIEVRMWNKFVDIYKDKLHVGTKVYVKGIIRDALREIKGLDKPIKNCEVHMRDLIIFRQPS